MKRILILGTIAAMALSTTAQARVIKEKKATRQVATRNVATAVPTTTNRTVVRRYYSPSYGGFYPYYGSGTSVSIGLGGGFGYPYGYGYGYPYGYGGYPSGYGYGYPYSYNTYPSDYYNGYSTTRYVTTSRGGDLAYDDNVVVAVQERLARAGYYHGAIDGVAGRGTRGAVARWEANHGMYADGRIDRRVLHSLGVS